MLEPCGNGAVILSDMDKRFFVHKDQSLGINVCTPQGFEDQQKCGNTCCPSMISSSPLSSSCKIELPIRFPLPVSAKRFQNIVQQLQCVFAAPDIRTLINRNPESVERQLIYICELRLNKFCPQSIKTDI